MYLEYFSLERHPFRITPDTSLFFPGGDEGRGVVLDAMLYAIESGEGILKVVGEVGSGKTMLCRMLEERIPATTEIVYLANPNLSPEEILYAVAFELKLPVRRDTSKLLVMQQLQNYLLRQHAANRKVLVIIEEAQGMPVETLEEIRLFSNLETHRDKLMQIILFGQPELDKNLSARNIRQLRERITHSFKLKPLNTAETAEYIRFRLKAAGCACPKLFSPRAEWLIAKAASGLTRRINILADKSLLAAFAENVLADRAPLNVESKPAIGCRHVMAAIKDSEYSASVIHSFVPPLRLLGATMLVGLIVAFLFWPETRSLANQAQAVPPTLIAEPLAVAEQTISEQALSERIKPAQTVAAQLAEFPIMEKPVTLPVPVAESPQPLNAGIELAFAATDAVEPEVVEIESALAPATDSLDQTSSEEMTTLTAVAYEPAPLATRQATTVARSLLQQRVLASIVWLRQANGNGYTVQFLSGETHNLEFAESFLQELQRADLLAEAYVCMSTDNVKSYWTIKYGRFEGMSMADHFIDQLPPGIKEYKPFVQNINGVMCNANNTIAELMLE